MKIFNPSFLYDIIDKWTDLYMVPTQIRHIIVPQ